MTGSLLQFGPVVGAMLVIMTAFIAVFRVQLRGLEGTIKLQFEQNSGQAATIAAQGQTIAQMQTQMASVLSQHSRCEENVAALREEIAGMRRQFGQHGNAVIRIGEIGSEPVLRDTATGETRPAHKGE